MAIDDIQKFMGISCRNGGYMVFDGVEWGFMDLSGCVWTCNTLPIAIHTDWEEMISQWRWGRENFRYTRMTSKNVNSGEV